MTARVIALICACLWCYAAVLAIVTHHLLLAGPCAAGFVACVFLAQLLQVPVPFDGQGE